MYALPLKKRGGGRDLKLPSYCLIPWRQKSPQCWREGRDQAERGAGLTTGSYSPSSIWMKPSCALSPSCAWCMISWRGKKIAWLNKWLNPQPMVAALALPMPWALIAASLTVCLSLSLSLWPEAATSELERKGLMDDLSIVTSISASEATSGKKIQDKCCSLWWCYDAQSRVKQSGLMMVRVFSCWAQQPDSSQLVEDSTKQNKVFPKF